MNEKVIRELKEEIEKLRQQLLSGAGGGGRGDGAAGVGSDEEQAGIKARCFQLKSRRSACSSAGVLGVLRRIVQPRLQCDIVSGPSFLDYAFEHNTHKTMRGICSIYELRPLQVKKPRIVPEEYHHMSW